MAETKRCSHCGRELPVAMFGKSSKAADGLQNWCNACKAEYGRERAKRKKAEKEALQTKLFVALKDAPEDVEEVKLDNGKTYRRVVAQNEHALKNASPRELLEELKARGYVWERMYVKQYIDFAKI